MLLFPLTAGLALGLHLLLCVTALTDISDADAIQMVCSASIGAQPNKKKKTKNIHPLLCFPGLGSSHFLILALPLSSNAPSPSAHYRSPADIYDHLQNSAMSIHRHNGIQIQHTEGERNTIHAHTVCYMSNTRTHTRAHTHAHTRTHRQNTEYRDVSSSSSSSGLVVVVVQPAETEQ